MKGKSEFLISNIEENIQNNKQKNVDSNSDNHFCFVNNK